SDCQQRSADRPDAPAGDGGGYRGASDPDRVRSADSAGHQCRPDVDPPVVAPARLGSWLRERGAELARLYQPVAAQDRAATRPAVLYPHRARDRLSVPLKCLEVELALEILRISFDLGPRPKGSA